MENTYYTHSPAQTAEIGYKLGSRLAAGDTVALFGGLGMGKTAFTRGLADGMDAPADEVSSPTFAILNEYRGRYRICHYDMYRVESWDDLESTGFFENIENAVTVIEWSENIENALPCPRWEVRISRGETDDDRCISVRYICEEEDMA
ncbi:MAG: tRNA (adenosine(37)-N6)-threonylcarbamoyltransferase complex ATPase subunit type 1 TsaE [Clostridia bacterium]|nr:tRNA (adenosine(37)-N6)-threonylcarbamoyltransferase complex ATPase subunit type 1 TsaE [Clostridia bacterium]